MLADRASYRRITGDTASTDADIDVALLEAQSEVQRYINRPGRLIEQGSVLEVLRAYRGAAFPSVQPVASVTDPPGCIVDRGTVKGLGGVIQVGGGFITGYGEGDNLYGLDVALTYVGGWTPVGSGGAFEVPVKLVRGICRLANQDLVGGAPVPVGARSVQAGDVRVDYATAQTPDAAREAILATLSGFRYRAINP